jgi:hypothetical protein
MKGYFYFPYLPTTNFMEEILGSKFDNFYTLITDNISGYITALSFRFDDTDSPLSREFDSLEDLCNNMRNEGSGSQMQLIEMARSLAADVQMGFDRLRLPGNIITDYLLCRVEGQSDVYLKRMVIQMVGESNDILRDL